MSLKSKNLTVEDVTLLDNEGWLSAKQKIDLGNYIGSSFTREQIEMLCADYNVVDMIFEYQFTPTNIEYRIYAMSHGLYKEGKPDVFTDVVEAIKHHAKKTHDSNSISYILEVHYN